ncbi:MAG: DUF5320 domain-containing protein [Candidatus Muiribacteriaceae bacterium]
MPGFDGSGPLGQGAMTGRGLGNCNPANAGRRTFYGYGRGAGRGFGRGVGAGYGRGFRNVYPSYAAPVNIDEQVRAENDELIRENDELRGKMADLEKRLLDLEQKHGK